MIINGILVIYVPVNDTGWSQYCYAVCTVLVYIVKFIVLVYRILKVPTMLIKQILSNRLTKKRSRERRKNNVAREKNNNRQTKRTRLQNYNRQDTRISIHKQYHSIFKCGRIIIATYRWPLLFTY